MNVSGKGYKAYILPSDFSWHQDSAECLKGAGGTPGDEHGYLARWMVAILTGG